MLPIWILGVVDYHGSRLVAFERIAVWPTSMEIAAALGRATSEHGAPARLLTDRAPIFRAPAVQDLLAHHRTRHSLIRPCHAWTNGRIERIFRTFKHTVFQDLDRWLLTSIEQVDRFCADFLSFYNRDRPHTAYGGRTPDEVFHNRPTAAARGRIDYFNGRLHWYRLG